MNDWYSMLKRAVNDSSITIVAEKLGVSRTQVSLVLGGKYPSRTEKFGAKVVQVYGQVVCPHLVARITMQKCREYHSAPIPTCSPRALRHWKACQACIHNRRSSC